MHARWPIVEAHLRSIFAEVMQRCDASREIPDLREVRIELNAPRWGAGELLVRFTHLRSNAEPNETQWVRRHMESLCATSADEEAYDYALRAARRRPRIRDTVDYTTIARSMWSEFVEDHLMNLQIQAIYRNYNRLAETCTDPAILAPYVDLMHRQIDDIRRSHFRDRQPPNYYQTPQEARRAHRDYMQQYQQQPYGITYTTETVPMQRLDAAGLSLERQRAATEQMRVMLDQQFRAMTGITDWPGMELGDAKAQKKGLELLKEHLTPEQLATYEKHNYFDVKGGKTGKTYRIHHGRQMNIKELDKDGKDVCGWCFLPQGNLVAGDVMLGQKTALELYEEDALKVANKFGVGITAMDIAQLQQNLMQAVRQDESARRAWRSERSLFSRLLGI